MNPAITAESEKRKNKDGADRIVANLGLIATCGEQIDQYLGWLTRDPQVLEQVSNRLSERIRHLVEVQEKLTGLRAQAMGLEKGSES